uniref:Uncharacterized protein n=1 Tax=Chromera velia CCMP2878 TaxID=1169474 RepID=A0A0G4GND5_9ALVE|eukprot:Cvel_4968.t1-p1 / transcript=Cvel_4968.t1 / gene=Cvel_4968 / organism=Chromera_velia_CCMP2878 / gene_product=hypothetical protein / transcript_product=hypothetical protein / location=Cvel_scaffold224:118955-119533(+) / protein_length=193 / sequence_SO=supercontig / SO=protein_coding / is_pseudo=false
MAQKDIQFPPPVPPLRKDYTFQSAWFNALRTWLRFSCSLQGAEGFVGALILQTAEVDPPLAAACENAFNNLVTAKKWPKRVTQSAPAYFSSSVDGGANDPAQQPAESDAAFKLRLTTFLREVYLDRVASSCVVASSDTRRRLCQNYIQNYKDQTFGKSLSIMELFKGFIKCIEAAGSGLQISDRDLGEAFAKT